MQARGLIAGGVDAVLIETCQDPLQIKAAVNAVKAARLRRAAGTPIFVQVTVETTGTLLVGADIAAAATVIQSLDVPLIGLNCATGPQEMSEHLRWLSANWPGLISVQPNAGLPELVDGHTALSAAARRLGTVAGTLRRRGQCQSGRRLLRHYARPYRAVDAMLRRLRWRRNARRRRSSATCIGCRRWLRSTARCRCARRTPSLSIGERCNANGSKKFRECQEREDWDGGVAIGREQVRKAATRSTSAPPSSAATRSRDMTAVVGRLRGSVTAPLVIDSTELPVIEAALKLYGGKAIINSINFENGEEPAAQRLELARKFGAAVIALTIDEEGMAKEVEAKLAMAHRLYDFAVSSTDCRRRT